LFSLKKAEDYRDTILGDVKLREDGPGNWVSEQGVKITAEDGRIVVTTKTGADTMVKRFEPTGKLESCSISNSRAKIDVEVNVKDEERWMKEFDRELGRDMFRSRTGEVQYKDVLMKFNEYLGIWLFEEPGRRRIQTGLDKAEKELWVIESNIHDSVERVDTKIFRLHRELLTFDSATAYGATSKINVKREEEEICKLLSNPRVKLREEALRQLEFQRYTKT